MKRPLHESLIGQPSLELRHISAVGCPPFVVASVHNICGRAMAKRIATAKRESSRHSIVSAVPEIRFDYLRFIFPMKSGGLSILSQQIDAGQNLIFDGEPAAVLRDYEFKCVASDSKPTGPWLKIHFETSLDQAREKCTVRCEFGLKDTAS